MAKLHSVILVNPGSGHLTASTDMIMSSLGDWIRVSTNVWFVWSDKTNLEISYELRQRLVPDTQYIVTAIDPIQATGNSLPWVWEWLNKKMYEQLNQTFIGANRG